MARLKCGGEQETSLQPGLSPQHGPLEREEAVSGGDSASSRLTIVGDDTRSGCSDDGSRSATDSAALLPFQFPKKRGRKSKKLLEAMAAAGMEVPKYKTPVRSSDPNKPRKKHDRFNGLTEEQLSQLTLPDHLAPGLDIVFIGINPGLVAAFKGHHYAGPGNHFWKCAYLAGLIPEPLGAEDDFRLIDLKIGFTNIVSRTTKGSQDLTRKEIKEGAKILLQKLQLFKPKIAVFNGKGIFEIFSGKKEFLFGKQPEKIEGTQTNIWVMPSSSARCAQLPRALDKVPFYTALKKFRDHLNGEIPEPAESELTFEPPKPPAARQDRTPPSETADGAEGVPPGSQPGDPAAAGLTVPIKKKRGRPRKIRLDENGVPLPETAPKPRRAPPADPNKKRGRPKKSKTEAAGEAAPGYPMDQSSPGVGGCGAGFGPGGYPGYEGGPQQEPGMYGSGQYQQYGGQFGMVGGQWGQPGQYGQPPAHYGGPYPGQYSPEYGPPTGGPGSGPYMTPPSGGYGPGEHYGGAPGDQYQTGTPYSQMGPYGQPGPDQHGAAQTGQYGPPSDQHGQPSHSQYGQIAGDQHGPVTGQYSQAPSEPQPTPPGQYGPPPHGRHGPGGQYGQPPAEQPSAGQYGDQQGTPSQYGQPGSDGRPPSGPYPLPPSSQYGGSAAAGRCSQSPAGDYTPSPTPTSQYFPSPASHYTQSPGSQYNPPSSGDQCVPSPAAQYSASPPGQYTHSPPGQYSASPTAPQSQLQPGGGTYTQLLSTPHPLPPSQSPGARFPPSPSAQSGAQSQAQSPQYTQLLSSRQSQSQSPPGQRLQSPSGQYSASPASRYPASPAAGHFTPPASGPPPWHGAPAATPRPGPGPGSGAGPGAGPATPVGYRHSPAPLSSGAGTSGQASPAGVTPPPAASPATRTPDKEPSRSTSPGASEQRRPPAASDRQSPAHYPSGPPAGAIDFSQHQPPASKADLATKSLSDLESLVDQIPSLGGGEGMAPAPARHAPPPPPPPVRPPLEVAPSPPGDPYGRLCAPYPTPAGYGYCPAPYNSGGQPSSNFSVAALTGGAVSPPASGAGGPCPGPAPAAAELGTTGGPYPYSAYGALPYAAGLHMPPPRYAYPTGYGAPGYHHPGYAPPPGLERLKPDHLDARFGAF
ncbi:basic proline-rich protein-like isoform X2 [Amphibalanus amphitrite]|uniref:basic proline-rich protein-like isoform X2 n=1 Tax=Amphibalanus amphitrite TaxID=1232801 RepID=UPI001C90078E|nr:basic proline-rich protein-like isoform X2 [Amphibalanus amphitrite]